MSPLKKVEAASMLSVAALALILATVGAPVVSQSDRGNDAWSQRLTTQAEHFQEKARAARAADAWSKRLTGLAANDYRMPDVSEQRTVGISDRAIRAWIDRLTGLAE